MNTMRQAGPWYVGLMLVVLSLFAQASSLTIDITQGNDQAVTVAVPPFHWAGKTRLSADVAAIVDNDLRLSGLFTPLPRDTMLSLPSKSADVYYRDWQVLGAAYLVIGQITPTATAYTIAYQLLDIRHQRVILTQQVHGTDSQLRALAHRISDAVYEQITGTKGDFSSKILYVTAQPLTSPQAAPANTTVNRATQQQPPRYHYQLHYADADGQQARVIFRSKEPILSPSWSPDGRQVAYVSFESGRSAIYLQELATGKRLKLADKLTNFKGVNSSPVWSPDGTKMAMALSQGTGTNIYVLNLAANRLSQLTRTPYPGVFFAEPDWMPDGKRLIFTSNRSGSAQIYQLGIRQLTNGRVVADGTPRRLSFQGRFNARAKVFPDGKSLALVHKGEQATAFNIAILDIDTQRLRLLTASRLEDSPSVAPSGKRLIYAMQGDQHGKLGIVSADGRVKYQLPSAAGDVREPVWGPVIKPHKS